jgi:hypothetical protein
MGVACRTYGEMKTSCRHLDVKPEEMRPLGTHRHKWEDNIKMDLKKIDLEHAEWIYVV